MRFIVPFSAGSGSDTIARIVATGLTETLGQQMIVDNRAGAAGNIGTEVAARAPADGYNMLLLNLGHASNATVYRNLPFDIVRDFAPVAQLASTPYILVVHPSLPAKSVAELVALARAKPGAINYSSIAESGYRGFQAGNWYGLAVPVKTSSEIVTALNRAALATLKNPAVNKRLVESGYLVIGDTPGEFGAHIMAEIASLARVLKDVKID